MHARPRGGIMISAHTAERIIFIITVMLTLSQAAVFAEENGTDLADWGFEIGQHEPPSVVIQKDEADVKIYPGHPRLYFRDTDLPAIRERIHGEFKPEWERLYGYASRTAERPTLRYAQRPKSWFAARAVTFVAAVTGEKKYHDWAVKWAEDMIGIGPSEGIDDNYRGRLMCLSLVYDWLYESLTEEQRRTIRDSIIEHIDKNWYFAEDPLFIGGHTRWGNFALQIGLLAVFSEKSEKPDYREKVLKVRKNFIEGYHPAQAWIALDGGYHMGWDYSSSYNTIRNHCIWSSATNEDVYYPYREQLPYFWIYGRLADGTFPRSGDNYGRNNLHHGQVVIPAGMMKNRHAAWLADINRSDDTFIDILYADKSVRPRAPGDPSDPLPLSRYFRNAGYVVFRDTWEGTPAVLTFKSTSFASINHQHRDQNSFSLYYPGRLAIDSGSYEVGSDYGTSHWTNYFTRTIAHNTITVFDPDESFGESVFGPRANDGGQIWVEDPSRLEHIQPGGYAHLDGITAYAEEGDYAFATGDASKAYSPHKLEHFSRTMVYLRTPAGIALPVVVVFDHVISPEPQFTKRWLLHSVREPIISPGLVEITEGEGRLHAVTVLPQDPKMETVGGPGKQFWVDGKNYPLEQRPGLDLEEAHIWAGEWRTEIVPPNPSREDHFLHVLAVSDAEKNTPPPDTIAIDGASLKGTVAFGHAVLFNAELGAASSAEYDLPEGAGTHIIIGMKPSTGYELCMASKIVTTAVSTTGGSVRFSVPQDLNGHFTIKEDQ
jgi:hypothetical protein